MTSAQFKKTYTLPEAQIQKGIAEYLQIKKWLVVRTNSGAMKDAKTGRFTKFYTVVNNGKSSGLPDLLAFKGNRSLLLEVKTEKGRLRESQKVFRDSARRYGVEVHVVRSVADVEQLIG